MRLLLLMTCCLSMASAQRHGARPSYRSWKAQSSFQFPLGGNSLGQGGLSFGDQSAGSTGMIEQISLNCVAPSEVLVQSVTLELPEDGQVYRYELDVRERPPAPNGSKTVVVSQAVKIRVRFGFGGFGIGLNVWNGPSSSSMKCTAALSGYELRNASSQVED